MYIDENRLAVFVTAIKNYLESRLTPTPVPPGPVLPDNIMYTSNNEILIDSLDRYLQFND